MENLQNNFVFDDTETISPELWRAYERSLIDPIVRNPERGHYGKTARRRRAAEAACPVGGSNRPTGLGTSGRET